MGKKLVGFFDSEESARHAIEHLRRSGFDSNEISLVSKHNEENNTLEAGLNSVGEYANQNIVDGTLTGGALGGLAGLALGASALLVSPIGAFLAAGPLSGLLAGAVSGGLAGGLIDYGIPEKSSKEYETKVEGGQQMVVMEVDEKQVDQAREILHNSGAQGVEFH